VRRDIISLMRIRKDLDTALAFVARRIEEEATQSGEPLSDDERLLLHYLPKHSVLPLPDLEYPMILPRDIAYERLCALGKAAYLSDLLRNPELALDWEFAAAVSKLNRHPMSWLLHWAGVKERKPWWDQWALLTAALLFIAFTAVPMVLAGAEPWTPLRWTAAGTGYVAAIALMYFASRRIEEWQLKRTIERCRSGPGPT
jgi:hypothetical protein